jgi:hypothetical protein
MRVQGPPPNSWVSQEEGRVEERQARQGQQDEADATTQWLARSEAL